MAAKAKMELPEFAPDSIYELRIKKGMKFFLLADEKSAGAKRGDVVTVTTVPSVFKGQGSNGLYNDYEMLRISNGKYSWRASRSILFPL